MNLIDYLYYLDGKGATFDFKYYNSVEHHLPQSRENYNKIDKSILDSIGNLFLLSRRANSSLNDGDPLTKADKSASVIDILPPNRKYIYQQTRKNRRWNPEDIINHEAQIRDLFSRKEDLLKVKKLEENALLYRACLAVADYCQFKGSSKYGDKYNFKSLYSDEAKKTIDIVVSWQYQNVDKGLEDFIQEQLESNIELNKDSWRKCFVKYPSIIDFCKEGNFSWNMDGLKIYLMPNNQIVNHSQELHCHLFKEKFQFNNTKIKVDQYGVWISLDSTPLKQSNHLSNIWLHLWLSDDFRHWCYEIWSERNTDTGENNILKRNGCAKNEEGNYYFVNRPFLCDSSEDYETSVDLALKCVVDIINEINHIK